MDVTAIERSDSGHGMDVSSVSDGNRQPCGSSDLMKVEDGEIRVGLEHMNVVITNGDDLAGHT